MTRRLLKAALAGVVVGVWLAPPVVHSAPRQITVSPDSELRFGTFLVFGSGARVVAPGGATTNVSIFPVPGDSTAPARFTVTYDRGNNAANNRRPRTVEIELVMSQPAPVTVNGVTGRVSAFNTDLPGVGRIEPGRAFRLTIPNCQTRTCSASFQIGGRIDVTRQANGAELTIPLMMDAVLISDG